MELPCGQCIGCRLAYSREWAVRCVHESRLHAENCFLTLTYAPEFLPSDLSLRHRDFQLFFKRLRERVAPLKPRYYMCGEYGEGKIGRPDLGCSRPHYHAAIFGFYPSDRVYFRKSEGGDKVYTSAYLDEVWQLGKVFLGDLTFESAAYIARYCLKKVGSDGKRREIVDVTTGEIVSRPHEYCEMSTNPAIGKEWFKRYRGDAFPRDYVVMRGQKVGVPRYYDKLLAVAEPEYAAAVKAARVLACDTPERFNDTSPARLRVQEVVKMAAIRSLKRR